jgi:valyl-tRNA synthetase
MGKAFNMDKVYAPGEIEGRIYQTWEESGAFHARRAKGEKPFTIVMPPPNITGQLHMGHAMDCLFQDVPIRYHRMKGRPTLWLPGSDHASIATEVKIVNQMREEGLSKEDVGREAFLARAWKWKEEYGGRINRQLRRLGASCDWARERFTMDEGCNRAVIEVFVDLYNKGLIYRGNRIINWCPVCHTALSDAEVEYEEQDSHLWYVRYPAKDGGEGVIVATTRPETMLGDTAVAVHPKDKRYKHLIGKTVILPIMNRELPVVADEYVDMEFGTGAVKITPAHDPNDFEIAQRHNLASVLVTNDDGTMNENAGKYRGVPEKKCRLLVADELKELGLLVKVEDYKHNVGTCYRCHTTVDPVTSLQWFVRMKPLARPAIEVVKDGQTKFVPERFSKVYMNWMESIRDWCISRQLWWGHRIPAWYCDGCGEIIVSKETPEKCAKCGSGNLHQDEDVLDTWFSSGLWPFSTLGWPEETEDLKYFYPTSTLVTGYDIIFFWVARMIVSGISQMGETPFDTVLIHGLVRDAQGRKMSKSLGNGVDPLDIIEKYGADALRFSLATGVSPGNDTRYTDEKTEAARNFVNKVWNASRFVLMNMETRETIDVRLLTLPDQWILSRLQKVIAETGRHIEDCDFGMAAGKLYEFMWSEFCDWYIELSKGRLMGEDEDQKRNVRAVLLSVLENILKLLHPFIPYVTEEVYGYLPDTEGMLITASWPELNAAYDFPAEEKQMEGIMEIIRAIRNLRAEMKVDHGRRTRIKLIPQSGWEDALAGVEPYLQRLAGASGVTLGTGTAEAEKTVSAVCASAEIRIPLGELVDIGKEIARLGKEKDNLENEIKRAEAKLNNPGFVAKAPAELVEKEKEKIEVNKGMLDNLTQRIRDLHEG